MNRPLCFSIAALLAATGPIFSAPPTAPAAAVSHGDGKTEAGAKDAANAIKTMKFDAGMKVELWANEPLLANPVSFATDERGRWFIAESYRQEGRSVDGKPVPGGVVDNRGHMNWLDADISSRSTDERLAMMHKFFPDPKVFAETFEKFEERIVVIEDTKGAGCADQTSVFVQEKALASPLGVAVLGNQVVVSQPPDMIVYTDVNGDGRFDPAVDKREVLLTGFGGRRPIIPARKTGFAGSSARLISAGIIPSVKAIERRKRFMAKWLSIKR